MGYTRTTLVHDTSMPVGSIPLEPVKNEGRWQRCIRELDWLDSDSMSIDLDGRTVDSVRRCLQQAIKSVGREGELVVWTDSDVMVHPTSVALIRLGG